MKNFTSHVIVAVTLAFLTGCSKQAESKGESEGNPSAQVVKSAVATTGAISPNIDDFSDANKNSLGIERQFIDDTAAGGQTRTQHDVEKGILSATGEIVPPRGQPGWASIVLLLDPQGRPQDASAYEGVQLLVRVNKGNLSVSANSSEITNFDYHAAQVTPPADGEFHEVKIPFARMKRAWSAQTTLNPKTLTSLSLVAFDVQPGSFDFAIDEVSFY
ncbi:hypothetical protein GC207_08440 [bacterium]|nr:hypothetical protein [bacterium]